jgi:hypothetical protein
MTCTHWKTEAIHHIRPEDRGGSVLPVLASNSV